MKESTLHYIKEFTLEAVFTLTCIGVVAGVGFILLSSIGHDDHIQTDSYSLTKQGEIIHFEHVDGTPLTEADAEWISDHPSTSIGLHFDLARMREGTYTMKLTTPINSF